MTEGNIIIQRESIDICSWAASSLEGEKNITHEMSTRVVFCIETEGTPQPAFTKDKGHG